MCLSQPRTCFQLGHIDLIEKKKAIYFEIKMEENQVLKHYL